MTDRNAQPRAIPCNRYRSYQDSYGNVWLWIKDPDFDFLWEEIQVLGDTQLGYHIHRKGRIGPRSSGGMGGVRIGSAGVFFEKRKDAENYALIAAMAINGDMRRKSLTDPQIFGGCRQRETPRVAYLRSLFWKGAWEIDPTEGWSKIDPDGLLLNLPTDNPLGIEYDEENEDFLYDDDRPEGRNAGIEELVFSITHHYQSVLNCEDVSHSFSSVCREIHKNESSLRPKDFSYAQLLVLSELRDSVPVSWIFPGQEEELFKLIPQLVSDLPEEATRAIAAHRA